MIKPNPPLQAGEGKVGGLYRTHKTHPVLTRSIVIRIVWNSIQFSLTRLDLETHVGVKCNRGCVDRCGDAANLMALVLACNREKGFI
jgi:hypothetical protein